MWTNTLTTRVHRTVDDCSWSFSYHRLHVLYHFLFLNKVFNHVIVELKTKAKSLTVFDADIKLCDLQQTHLKD